MNIVLWVSQGVLALLGASGGAYKAFAFADMAKQMNVIPHGAWRALGVLEIACAILLIVPAATGWQPMLTPLAGAVLAVEALLLAALYARYSTKLSAENPLVWSVVIALLAAFVAYGRYALHPIA